MAASVASLLVLGRWIHAHLQGTALLLTGKRSSAVVLYALPLFPGIILHEVSHAMAAWFLRVHTGRLSLRPTILPNGRIRLGYVSVDRTDSVRSSLIAIAPLLTGSAIILAIGYWRLGVDTVGDALMGRAAIEALGKLARLAGRVDALVWAYLVFAVGNTMMPSRSDRLALAPVALFGGSALLVLWLAGYGPDVFAALAEPASDLVRWLAYLFTLIVLADLPFLLMIAAAERILQSLKNRKVRYR
jgi:hypothetical protein